MSDTSTGLTGRTRAKDDISQVDPPTVGPRNGPSLAGRSRLPSTSDNGIEEATTVGPRATSAGPSLAGRKRAKSVSFDETTAPSSSRRSSSVDALAPRTPASDATDTESPPTPSQSGPGLAPRTPMSFDKITPSEDSQNPSRAYKRAMEKLPPDKYAKGPERTLAKDTDKGKGSSTADTITTDKAATLTTPSVKQKERDKDGSSGADKKGGARDGMNGSSGKSGSTADTGDTSTQATEDPVTQRQQRSSAATGVVMPPSKPKRSEQTKQDTNASALSKDTDTDTTTSDTDSGTISKDTATSAARPVIRNLVDRAIKDAQERHMARIDADCEANKSTHSIARRAFAGDTATVDYRNGELWRKIRKQWEKEMIQPGMSWEDIKQQEKKNKYTYMPWDDGTRTRLFENDIQGTKFTYDTANLGPSAATKTGWVSNHWKDMSVSDVQSTVLALLTDKQRETFYSNMSKARRKKKIKLRYRAQRHEQAGNNVNLLLDRDQRKKVYDPELSSLGVKGAMDMYSQIKQMSDVGLMPERPDFTITSPLYRPFQTGCLTQGLTLQEIEAGKAPSPMLAAPGLREELSGSHVSRVHKTANILHSDWRANMQEGTWRDEGTGTEKMRKYLDPWEKRRGESDEELALRIKDDFVPYLGIVADTLARTKEGWDTDDEIEVDVHGIMHHEILAMANKALGIPENTPGNEWQNGEMRPMEFTVETDGFLGQEGSTMSAQVTKVWNPLYPRKYNLAGLEDLPKELDGHRDRQSLVERLMRRSYTSIADKFKPRKAKKKKSKA